MDAKGDKRSAADNERLAAINDKLGGIDVIEKRLADPSKETFLLGIDTAGNGRAIIAAGNPDTAANVVTSVPGTGARLGDVGSAMDRSDAMAEAANRAGSPSTAAISWIGYDAPQSIFPDATETHYARDAVKDLARFQEGLRASHEGAPSHNTVLGHSYGSTVIGHTAHAGGLQADEVVFVGSPGVSVLNAGQLNFPTDHVWATVAAHDAINLSNNDGTYADPVNIAVDLHGPDPADPRFGGKVFASDPGTPGALLGTDYSNAAHSEYWSPRNIGLRNMGRIIAGQPL